MKTCLTRPLCQRAQQSAFTMIEMMVSASLMIVVVSGIVYAHIGGLKFYTLSMAKIGASAQARQALSDLTWEVRGAQSLAIGTGNLTNFVQVPIGTNQIGNALQVYRYDYNPTNNSNSYVRWYLDGVGNVYRLQGTNSTADKIVNNITNTLPFSAIDRSGNVLTAFDNNQVISVVFQFYQIQYPIVKIGSNQLFDFFQLTTKIAPRYI